MIVRISGEGQWRVPDDQLALLNELDDHVVEAVQANDEAEYRRRLAALVDAAIAAGEGLDDDEIVVSDIVIPSPDTTLAEARELFIGEGLIPN
jgi:hypothetical protein